MKKYLFRRGDEAVPSKSFLSLPALDRAKYNANSRITITNLFNSRITPDKNLYIVTVKNEQYHVLGHEVCQTFVYILDEEYLELNKAPRHPLTTIFQ